MATNNLREAQQRAREKLAERRQREDQLIDAAADALAVREEAQEALASAEAALAEAVANLADLGIGRDELASLLDVAPEQLGGKAKGRPRKPKSADEAADDGAAPPSANGSEGAGAGPSAAGDDEGEASETTKPAAGRTRKGRTPAASASAS